tara:strand:- start:464 stop:919 length:456 start_codon:yes stop_codon:yes gene_type:complete
MIAVVNIEGKQFKVEKDAKILIDKLQGKKGDKVVLENVSLIDNNGKITVGTPNIKDACVTASILEHTRDKKIIVFKKKRRKGYRLKNGHKQMLTMIKIDSISTKSSSNKSLDSEAKKTTAKKTTAKKTTAKKTTAKKTAIKKTATKKTTAN